MERWKNRVAVVSGANSGIGAACVRLIVLSGLQVVGLARRTELLEQLRQSLPKNQRQYFHCCTCDVSLEQDVKKTFDWIEKELGGCDILVNNAGIMRDGYLVEMPVHAIRDVINTNLLGPIFCLQSAVKSMRKRNFAGHVIFINSTAGLPNYRPRPNDPSLNVYTPTKYALNAINEICRQELTTLNTKVKTTNISPGWVSTPIIPDETKIQLGDVILKPDDIASAVLYALSTPSHVQIQEITLRAVGEWF